MKNFNTRKATINDSSFFYEVKKTVLRNYIEQIWGWDEAFQIKFHEENFYIGQSNVVLFNEQNAGTLTIVEDEEKFFISGLYLLPTFQNKGIGTGIICDCINAAKSANKRVELEVLKVNTEAQKLYRKLGFELTEKDDTKYFMFKDCNSEQT